MKIEDKLPRKAEFKDRLKDAMSSRGMKQADLIVLTKIPKSAMSQYLSGYFEPKKDRLSLLAKALNVSEAWLEGYDVPMRRVTNVYGYEDNPRQLELCDYFETLTPEEQEEMLSYVKEYSNGTLKTNSPGALELTEGEKAILELFRRVPKEKQVLVLSMIRVALEQK